MDNMRFSRLPSAVIHPAEEDELAAVLKIANQYLIPITARGAGSATTGATTPEVDGWVIGLSSWKNLHIDAGAMMAFVQPGVTIQAIDDAAREHGLFFPPDPGSKKFATIGGALACNAGGLRGAKYGVTRDYVFGLEGLMANGEFVKWGANLRKYVSGYNIRDLWIGSEGTLGIITGAVLKLLPTPASRVTLLAAFSDERSALETVRKILEARLTPAILEFLDSETVECFRRSERVDELPDWMRAFLDGPVLLIEFDGHQAEVDESFATLREILGAQKIHFKSTTDEDEAEVLWTIRRGSSKAMFQLGNTKLNEDIVVPLEAQIPLLGVIEKLRQSTGLPCPTFGHAADGNFHVHIMYNREDQASCEKAKKGINELMQAVVELGGVITGEHGVGLAKSPFLRLQHSAFEVDLMQRLKLLFDPNNILNPGKMFEPFEVWEHPREEVKMPWDH
jgi:glycolate oxidase